MRLLGKTAALALVVLSVCCACFAQGRRPGGPGQFGDKFKYTFELMRMTRGIDQIDRNAKVSLKPDQAKRVLAVLKPLRSKPKLTQAQAQQALKSLKPIFTATQTKAMASIRPGFGPGGGQRPGGRPGGPPPGASAGKARPTGARPAGPPPGARPGGNRAKMPRMNPAAFENFNPFYKDPKAKDPRAAMMSKRWDGFFAALEKKAKLATAKAAPKKK